MAHLALSTSYQNGASLGPHRIFILQTTDETCVVSLRCALTTGDSTDGVEIGVLDYKHPVLRLEDGAVALKYKLLQGSVTTGVWVDADSAPVTVAATAYTAADSSDYDATVPTTAAGALDQLAQRLRDVEVHEKTTQASIVLNLYSFREVNATGDVGNAAANGGILASDTTPIMLGDANNSAEIQWATGNADPVGTSFMLPTDFDDTGDATLDLVVKSGITDAATMGVATSWNGGSEVADSADDSGTKSASYHTITATIATADIPSGSNRVTIRLTPPAHSTNAISLAGARLNYKRKLLTS